MKIILVTVAVTIFLALGIFFASSTSMPEEYVPPQGYEMYSDDSFGATFAYPENWSTAVNDMGTVYLDPAGKSRTYTNDLAISNHVTVSQVLHNADPFELDYPESSTVVTLDSGIKAIRYESERITNEQSRFAPKSRQMLQYATEKLGDAAYSVILTVYGESQIDDYEAEVIQIANSLRNN